jgi:hypothetical protein
MSLIQARIFVAGHSFGAFPYPHILRSADGPKMASPYQVWVVQQMNSAISDAISDEKQKAELTDFLTGFKNGTGLMNLDQHLKGCRVR